MEKEHNYSIKMQWTGNTGEGTRSYTSYSRNHDISAPGKMVIPGSSDPSFRGDKDRYNPEELLLSTLSSCHMLFYLHFCAVNKITVTDYVDQPTGIMQETKTGSGYFKSVTLCPEITIMEADKVRLADELHHEAHEYCFIANSVNFEVVVKPIINVLK